MSQNKHDLKQLQTRLAKAKAEATSAKDEIRIAQKREADSRKLCFDLEQRISRLERKTPMMTEHALLRYFERVLGYDLAAIERGLLTESALSVLSQIGTGKIPSVGCRLVAKDGVIVTLEV